MLMEFRCVFVTHNNPAVNEPRFTVQERLSISELPDFWSRKSLFTCNFYTTLRL
jgi:hypothetical protein